MLSIFVCVRGRVSFPGRWLAMCFNSFPLMCCVDTFPSLLQNIYLVYLQQLHETLCLCIAVGIFFARYADNELVVLENLYVVICRILHTAVEMVNTWSWLGSVDRLRLERGGVHDAENTITISSEVSPSERC